MARNRHDSPSLRAEPLRVVPTALAITFLLA
jgi:hypothetical protein